MGGIILLFIGERSPFRDLPWGGIARLMRSGILFGKGAGGGHSSVNLSRFGWLVSLVVIGEMSDPSSALLSVSLAGARRISCSS